MLDPRAQVSAFYETYRDEIYRFLVAQGLRPAVAQEVTQDVFVDLFIALRKGAQVNSTRAWLYTVAGRAVVDHWRHERPAMWAEGDSASTASADIPSREHSPEAQAEYNERLARVAAGLQKLPRERRLCLHLRMQGLPYREIAKILHVSTSTAAEWLLSAIDSLRDDANG